MNPDNRERRSAGDAREASLREVLDAARKGDVLGTHKKVVKKSEELTARYGRAMLQRSRLYHLMIGSTPVGAAEQSEETAEIDEAIAAFIRSLADAEDPEGGREPSG